MNENLWVQRISKTEAPPYPCPHCGTGILVLDKSSLVRHPTIASLRQQSDDAWDPDIIVYSFSCWLKCAAPKCGGLVAVVGRGCEEAEWNVEHGTIWEERFMPKFAWPMPPVFTIPEACPDSVADELRASFQAIWSDQAAAASRLRVALEHLLDQVGIRRRRRTAKRFEVLTLHQRIELLAKTQPLPAGNLMAVKWLGNTGSHDSTVSLEDLLSVYEIMEPTLDTMLGERAKRVALLAKHLTKKHRRRRRKVQPGT